MTHYVFIWVLKTHLCIFRNNSCIISWADIDVIERWRKNLIKSRSLVYKFHQRDNQKSLQITIASALIRIIVIKLAGCSSSGQFVLFWSRLLYVYINILFKKILDYRLCHRPRSTDLPLRFRRNWTTLLQRGTQGDLNFCTWI